MKTKVWEQEDYVTLFETKVSPFRFNNPVRIFAVVPSDAIWTPTYIEMPDLWENDEDARRVFLVRGDIGCRLYYQKPDHEPLGLPVHYILGKSAYFNMGYVPERQDISMTFLNMCAHSFENFRIRICGSRRFQVESEE